MQNLSFDFKNPLFDFNGLRFGVQIFTFENVYGLDPDRTFVTGNIQKGCVVAEGLTWAGGQEKAPGNVTIEMKAHNDRTTFKIEASCLKTIRCVKLFLTNVATGPIANFREAASVEIPADGRILRYPDGWRGLYTPLLVLQNQENAYQYFRSLDTQVREKRFVLLPSSTEKLDVELLFEEDATVATNKVSVPVWEVGNCSSLEAIMAEQTDLLERSYQLERWEERTDVPEWAKEIALVAAIHCQHWTGYVFNDYAKVIETLKWLADRFDPQRTLIYLPGWEGRYYWQYGDYRPDARMGGEEGFAKLARTARDFGFHLMPMFGINVVNRSIENFEQWGGPALTSHAGGVPGAGSVDWDGSRHYDHASGAMLNPGAPTWQNRLVTQITDLAEKYGFDGVFLDISAVWNNDPRWHTFDGVVKLCQRIRQNHPEILIAGEGWYDAIGLATPLMQAGHNDGPMNWHDATPYPELFDRYNRGFAHLCLGDPSRGSTGVHELGYNPVTTSPLRRGIIPTVTIVEDTLEQAPATVEAIIADAERYSELYLAKVGVNL